MLRVATFITLEQAEEAGAKLIEHDISTKLDAHVHASVFHLLVAENDFDRAVEILDFPNEEPPPDNWKFHPCPSCGTPDPLWYGKRAVFLLAALIVAIFIFRASAFFWYLIVGGTLLFMVFALRIPEFQCRNCGTRWRKEASSSHTKEDE